MDYRRVDGEMECKRKREKVFCLFLGARKKVWSQL